MKVLIVEDDAQVAALIKADLTSAAHTVEVATDGGEGSFLARSYEYDAIVLDYSLPKKDGVAVCKEIRAAGKSTPIIFLSSTDDPDTKVSALDAGADDYMTKPFSLQELVARLQAVTRRPGEIKSGTLSLGDLILDPSRHGASRGGEAIRLTRKEFGLLEYLMRNQGTVISRSLLLEHVWTADSDPLSNTVEVHMRNLRRKLNTSGKPDLFVNVPGRGYVMDTPDKLKGFSGK